MENKQTAAVEWLIDKLTYDNGFGQRRMSFDESADLGDIFNQALEMQRTQTKQAYEAGQEDEYQYHINAVPRTDSETWYSETYGKESNHSEQAIEMQRPRWVQFSERKPTESKQYYIKGKGGYGGYYFYDTEEGTFDFRQSIPSNKVDYEYLQWLEE